MASLQCNVLKPNLRNHVSSTVCASLRMLTCSIGCARALLMRCQAGQNLHPPTASQSFLGSQQAGQAPVDFARWRAQGTQPCPRRKWPSPVRSTRLQPRRWVTLSHRTRHTATRGNQGHCTRPKERTKQEKQEKWTQHRERKSGGGNGGKTKKSEEKSGGKGTVGRRPGRGDTARRRSPRAQSRGRPARGTPPRATAGPTCRRETRASSAIHAASNRFQPLPTTGSNGVCARHRCACRLRCPRSAHRHVK